MYRSVFRALFVLALSAGCGQGTGTERSVPEGSDPGRLEDGTPSGQARASGGVPSDPMLIQDPVSWSARSSLDDEGTALTQVPRVSSGDTFSVSVEAQIAPGWYIYSISQGEGGPVPSRISLAREQPFQTFGEVRGPVPKVKFDQNFMMEVEMHEGGVAYDLPVLVLPEADPQATEIMVQARYQACTDRVCLPAQTERIPVGVRIVPGA